METYTPLFNKCIDIILVNEGGFQNHPNDLGNWTGANRTGELKGTKYGIAARFFPNLDIKNLTINQAKDIYFWHYWSPMNLEGIEDELSALQIFDFGVNAGKGRAIRTAQKLVGAVVDGICGKQTTSLINLCKEGFAILYKRERILYYKHIAERDPKNSVFLNGWIRRVQDTHFNH